ncbi:hypothetical protein ACOMHN_040042 [Nucella lapillus]
MTPPWGAPNTPPCLPFFEDVFSGFNGAKLDVSISVRLEPRPGPYHPSLYFASPREGTRRRELSENGYPLPSDGKSDPHLRERGVLGALSCGHWPCYFTVCLGPFSAPGPGFGADWCAGWWVVVPPVPATPRGRCAMTAVEEAVMDDFAAHSIKSSLPDSLCAHTDSSEGQRGGKRENRRGGKRKL